MPARVALLLTLCACGGETQEDPEDRDASADAGPDAEAEHRPAEPAPPALPVMTPCPAGWREIAAEPGGPVRCDPWPEGGPATCADDEAHFPGTEECEVVGTPCGDGEWATDLPEDGDIVYVRAGAVAGNGLEQNPFGDLQHAIDVASTRGAIVALSKGTYDGFIDVVGPVTLWGACTAETILTRTEDVYGPIAAVVGPAEGSTIRNLSITGDHIGVYAWDLDGPLVLDSVVIQAKESGIYLDEHTDLQATNLFVHDTALMDDGRAGYGLTLIDGAQATVTRSVFLRNRSASLAATEGSTLTVRDTAVIDALIEQDEGAGGIAIEADSGSHIVVERVAIVDPSLAGVVALDEGSLIEVTDVVIDGVEPAEESGGILALFGARLVARRVDVSGSTAAGIKVVDSGSTGDLEDVVVVGTAGFGILNGGIGFGVGETGTADVRRMFLANNAGPSLLAQGEGTSLVAEDLTIVDTTGIESPFGFGMTIVEGPVVDLTRVRVARSTGGGVLVLGTLNLIDALVEDTARDEIDVDGWGISVIASGRVDAQRLVVRNNFGVGIGTSLAGRFIGRDVVVEGTGTATGVSSGILAATPDASVELTGFLVADGELCGLQIGDGAFIDLHDGEIRGNPIGANVQDPDFDLARIQDGVRYVDNGTPLDTSELPVPILNFAQ